MCVLPLVACTRGVRSVHSTCSFEQLGLGDHLPTECKKGHVGGKNNVSSLAFD